MILIAEMKRLLQIEQNKDVSLHQSMSTRTFIERKSIVQNFAVYLKLSKTNLRLSFQNSVK